MAAPRSLSLKLLSSSRGCPSNLRARRRPRRGPSVVADRGDAAAPTWIFRGKSSEAGERPRGPRVLPDPEGREQFWSSKGLGHQREPPLVADGLEPELLAVRARPLDRPVARRGHVRREASAVVAHVLGVHRASQHDHATLPKEVRGLDGPLIRRPPPAARVDDVVVAFVVARDRERGLDQAVRGVEAVQRPPIAGLPRGGPVGPAPCPGLFAAREERHVLAAQRRQRIDLATQRPHGRRGRRRRRIAPVALRHGRHGRTCRAPQR
mmetsp:Transcript_2648/g.8087  ORF Transcript_2648/g.8087 Transcript_2648/m.8087 type:complete len:266 (-) Transcript_2648:424-1221(-)